MSVLLIISTFCVMEFVAWFTHKYIMHGFMWRWHKSHHSVHNHMFEKNDLFAVVFALMSSALIVLSSEELISASFFPIGIGVCLYGVAYFLVHDVFVHQRIKLLKKTNNNYFKAMRKAHKIHHKTLTKRGAEAFGFLYVPKKYLKKTR
ncbi:MAG: beta-carotene hydroxylase [Bacteroidota bacterium]|nr:beta-carotene hydroxylase [Bacteroidota bacterium]